MRTIKDLDSVAEDYKRSKSSDVKVMAKEILNKHKDVKCINKRYYIAGAIIVTGSLLAFFVSQNMNSVFVEASYEIPTMGNIAHITKVKEYEQTGDGYDIKVDNVHLEGIENSELFAKLNTKYNEDYEEQYMEFLSKIDKGISNIHLSSKYIIKVDNGTTVTIEHCIIETAGSAIRRYEYDTVDIKNEKYITLPSLFKDDSYIEIINNEIKNQMKEEMKNDDSKVYFIDTLDLDKININTQFYISEDSKLIIVFNEYEIAPGYMGKLEFIIPTNLIEDILEDNYIM